MQRRLSWLRFGESRWTAVVAAGALAVAVLTATAARRSFEYDEAYTFFLTAGVPRPPWPSAPFLAGQMRGFFRPEASLASVAAELRATDVHPPVYFWIIDLWRRFIGGSLLATRLFSVACAVAGLAAVARIASIARIPAATAVLITIGCYGFAYTGAVARGFALAQALSLWGAALAFSSRDNRNPATAGASGLLLGAATATNYLAVFVACAMLFPRRLSRRTPDATAFAVRNGCIGCFALTLSGFAAFLPLDLWFFAAQHASRTGQFPPFAWVSGTIRLAQCFAGALLGALPRYMAPPWSMFLQALLGLFLLVLLGTIALRWRTIGRPGPRRLIALAAVAPALGLLLLGIIFDNTPIEVRYLAFAMPFWALLLAGALSRRLMLALICVQALSVAGLILRTETMQPARAAARAAASLVGPNGLVLLPYGNDGVGVVGPFLAEAPDSLRILVVRPGTTADQLAAVATGTSRIVLALLGPDATSRQTLPIMRAAFAPPCWQPVSSPASVLALNRVC